MAIATFLSRPLFSWNPTTFTTLLTTLLLLTPLVSAHFELTYPQWRGNTLEGDMQWMYPCGNLSVSQNRTKWPMTGGRIQVTPGWNSGHPTAFIYVNMGYGDHPANHSNPMVPVFQMTGPSRDPYPGSFCLQGVPLPANGAGLNPGDHVTIQVIQVALHGAGLFNCADVILVATEDEATPMRDRCENSTTIGFNQVYTTKSKSAGIKAVGDINLRLTFAAAVVWSIWLVGGYL